MPPGLAPPAANAALPELHAALRALEAALRPARPPSSTIAVNRNAQFRPHRDSGAGNGQVGRPGPDGGQAAVQRCGQMVRANGSQTAK